jgi:cold-inducible RNA-binding protein
VALSNRIGTLGAARRSRKERELMGSKLFVGNLDFSITRNDLETLFSEIGPLRDIFLPIDRTTSRPRGFAFVEFESAEDANRAIARFNGHELSGRALRVNAAEERAPRIPSLGGGDPSSFPGGFSKPKGSRRNIRGKKRSL